MLEEKDPLSLEFIQDGLIFLQNVSKFTFCSRPPPVHITLNCILSIYMYTVCTFPLCFYVIIVPLSVIHIVAVQLEEALFGEQLTRADSEEACHFSLLPSQPYSEKVS